MQVPIHSDIRSCPCCQNSQKLSHLWGTDIIQCPVCSLGYVNRLPTEEELIQLYSSEFFKGETAYADYVAEKNSLQRNFQQRIAWLLKFSKGGNLFEAGCAHGFFLDIARQHWNVSGIDISDEAVRYAQDKLGLDVAVGDFESHPPTPNSYDAIVMWDTIEHLYDPFFAIQESVKGLRSGGILALTTGDVGALIPRIQKKAWRLIHPTHLYYFSRRSMCYLLEQNGMEVIHFSHETVYRTLSQFTRVLTIGNEQENWRHRLVRQIDKLPLLNSVISLNLYDIMFVVARKP